MAERVGFEPTWDFKTPIRFRVGAIMTALVPLQFFNQTVGGNKRGNCVGLRAT